MDSIPLVVITGQVPTDALGSDAFQESDMTGITLPIVKHSYLVKDAADIPAIIAQAYHIASTGRPGPWSSTSRATSRANLTLRTTIPPRSSSSHTSPRTRATASR